MQQEQQQEQQQSNPQPQGRIVELAASVVVETAQFKDHLVQPGDSLPPE